MFECSELLDTPVIYLNYCLLLRLKLHSRRFLIPLNNLFHQAFSKVCAFVLFYIPYFSSHIVDIMSVVISVNSKVVFLCFNRSFVNLQ